jgi:pyridinium-3,5-biscarboxylic acid mononucleotide sulfurtransferase
MDRVVELTEKLESWLKNIDKAAIALSGGIDSSLVAFAARKQLGRDNSVAIISASASVKYKELNDARNFCSLFDIQLIEIDSREIDDVNYRNNPINRCFFCKSALYNEMEKLIAGKFPGYAVLNGNNFSDFGDFRPGLKAAEEHKIYSPLAECKFDKDDIRLLSKHYGLPNWNKPASPCLSSRFPYGESISVDKLKMVEKAEDLLNHYGFEDVRVRYIENNARIEVQAEKIAELEAVFAEIKPEVISFGFIDCEIDPEGLVSGKLNRAISK